MLAKMKGAATACEGTNGWIGHLQSSIHRGVLLTLLASSSWRIKVCSTVRFHAAFVLYR